MEKDPRKPVRGTAEWAVAIVDCGIGCPHGCRYCYARAKQVDRLRLVSPAAWSTFRIDDEAVQREYPLYPGQVMFPAHHDIVPENLAACCAVLHNLLAVGNRVLVVSKPHLDCIETLCRELRRFRAQLLFRFTITARDDRILAFWEPQAPGYAERRAALALAFGHGFATSVSVEPMLDGGDVVAMVHDLLPLVSHSIWIGRMNRVGERVICDSPAMAREIERIERQQDDAHIREIYRQLRDLPTIRWKESIKIVLGLAPAAEPGLDI